MVPSLLREHSRVLAVRVREDLRYIPQGGSRSEADRPEYVEIGSNRMQLETQRARSNNGSSVMSFALILLATSCMHRRPAAAVVGIAVGAFAALRFRLFLWVVLLLRCAENH